MTHFQALFGYPPPCRELSTQAASSVAAVNEMIARRVTTDQWLQKQWDMAKNRMKQMIDKHGIERISSWGLCPFEASTIQTIKHSIEKALQVQPVILWSLENSTEIGSSCLQVIVASWGCNTSCFTCLVAQEETEDKCSHSNNYASSG